MDPVWEKLHAARSWGKYPSESLVTTVMRAWRDPEERKKIRVLEMGCGAGANLGFFLNEGFQVCGIDGAPSAIANAKSRLEPKKAQDQMLDLKVCTFEDVPFETDTFDIVVDYFAIYANPITTILGAHAEAKRMLKPGGKFYSRVWGDRSEGAESGTIIESGTSKNPTSGPCKDMGVSHFFSLEELQDLFSSWSCATYTRHTSENIASPGVFIEEWVVWATK